MEKTEVKRQDIIEKVADYVLTYGLQNASLRSIAAAIGTSDRMLLYYFENKEALLTATLTLVMENLVNLLASAQAEPMAFQTLVPHLAMLRKDPRIRPYLRLWLELATLSAGGETFYRAIAQQLGAFFLQWIASALVVEQEEQRQSLAALTLVMVEGFVFLDAFEYELVIATALEGLSGKFLQ